MQVLTDWQRQFCEAYALPKQYISECEKALVWLKRSIANQSKPICIAVSGCQGSGKSTLSAYFVAYLKSQGKLAESVSIDDFYYSKSKRQVLASLYSPLFLTRGAPGTHDIQRAIDVINDFKQSKPFVLPRFDKAADEPYPEDSWTSVTSTLDVLVFEGWCLGLSPQPLNLLKSSCNQFESQRDAERSYRSQVNDFLSKDYQFLFSFFDSLVFLNGQNFEYVYQWRLEQEQKLIASRGKGMNEQQVHEFIQSYQRLTEWGIETLPTTCDLELILDKDRGFS
ncbi:kinase [Pseudoalteromonas luteoviolacea]|uniref:kinase n=1 Tax=Pseudoalteromonas luteoviolacea TaxID=43657 RepID=UPI001F20624C|nr:kinase [Pseudoalteromonas luteoviolacea]MCF6442625.1 kinase [Pseudoalteromonas luteoviolacea]